MKKKIAIIMLLILVFFPLYSLLFPRDYSDYLQRPLKDLPKLKAGSLLTGEWTGDFEAYISDRFAFKVELLTAKAYTSYGAGIRQFDNIIADRGILYQRPLANPRAVEFASKNEVDLIPIPYKINYASHLPKAVEVKGVKEDIGDNYFKVAGSKPEGLFELDDYFKGDHHLNHKGQLKLLESLGLAGDFSQTESYKFRGGLSRKTGLVIYDEFVGIYPQEFKDMTALADGKEISLYNFDKLETADPYLFYLAGNYGQVDIEGSGEGNVNIIKDSFANPIIPFFARKYAKVRALDPRFLRGSLEDKLLDGKTYVIGGF